MEEMFEEVFAQVGEEHACGDWWEVYDSELFDEVCERITARLGYDCWDCDAFVEWQSQMAEDL